jgi:hypothetical protein
VRGLVRIVAPRSEGCAAVVRARGSHVQRFFFTLRRTMHTAGMLARSAAIVALAFVSPGCRRTPTPEPIKQAPEETREPPHDAPAPPTPKKVAPQPIADACPASELPAHQRRAREAIDRGGALSRKREWKHAIEAYDVALEVLELCADVVELRARACAERGFAKFNDGDLVGAEADCDRALATSEDEHILGAASVERTGKRGLRAVHQAGGANARDAGARVSVRTEELAQCARSVAFERR